jgi:hypothetical protein
MKAVRTFTGMVKIIAANLGASWGSISSSCKSY